MVQRICKVPALRRSGCSDQYGRALTQHHITQRASSIPGAIQGAWRDNVFVERVWRSAKYERIYLSAYDGVTAARTDIAEYFDWYNTQRPHSSLDRMTPEQTYLNLQPKLSLAA